MAACTATLIDTKPGWATRVAERNAALLAQQSMRRRGVRTPEVIFTHHIDNSRLVKAADPVRARQMRTFSAALTVLFSLIMFYGLQHFNAIENSYRIESEKQVREQLREENRQLRLTEAQLSRPGRIDGMARQLGMAEPQPGQVVHATTHIDNGATVLAQVNGPASNPVN
jgi:cell division protein FtsL